MNEKAILADKIVDAIDKLPPIPENIVKLRQISANPNVNFTAIVPILKEDPGLCADILHMSNSAFYGANHRVETIDEAVRIFGVDHLIDFVAISFSEKVVRRSFAKIKTIDQYFVHSRQISIATSILTKVAKKDRHRQNIATIAGLLHDIGRLVIMVVSEKATTKLIGPSWNCVAEIVIKEKEILGLDHCDIGMRICKKWLFPEHLQNAVYRHHTPLGKKLNEDSAYILLAHFLSMDNIPLDMLINLYPVEVMETLALDKEKLIEAKAEFKENWKGSV